METFFLSRLLEWFENNRRDFPWRSNMIDPFASVVTELLLQRTKAENVASFYPIIENYYTSPEKILKRGKKKLIQDLKVLGLQDRRSDALLHIARHFSDQHGGNVPADEKSLMKLHGVGRYIARAVLCFAFDQPVSIVDSNVTRVFSRFFDMQSKGDNRRNKHYWKKGDDIITLKPGEAPRINWAILDFAALICKPRNPDCGELCPIHERCMHFAKISR